MKDVSSPPLNDVDSASMIIHVGKKTKKPSKKSSNNVGDVQPRDGGDKGANMTPSK
jgi:hypothetical protein